MTEPNREEAHPEATSRAARPHIRTVADLQRDFTENRRTVAERVGDLIGGFVGSFTFIALQVLVLATWIVVNLGVIPGISPFDQPPFSLLQLLLAGESIFLLTFVLIRENRLRRQSDRRDQLELQVNLLADNKASEILKTLRKISEHLGLDDVAEDEEVKRLSHKTHLETLEHELDENLPE